MTWSCALQTFRESWILENFRLSFHAIDAAPFPVSLLNTNPSWSDKELYIFGIFFLKEKKKLLSSWYILDKSYENGNSLIPLQKRILEKKKSSVTFPWFPKLCMALVTREKFP